MGMHMRQKDWAKTSLGPPEHWPQSLRTVVRLMLNTGHPTYIWWGPELACMYNDAYSVSIGPERHPGSLGQPAQEVWREIWDIIGPQIEQVMEGRGATWHQDQLVPITRHGRREDVYWTYSFSPVDHDEAPHGVGGVLVLCAETTERVQYAQRATGERDRLEVLFAQSPAFTALLSGPNHRFELANPRYQELVGNRPLLGLTVAEALPEIVGQGYVELLDRVFATGIAYEAKSAKYQRPVSTGGAVREVYLNFVYQPVRNPAGEVTGIFIEGFDVTEASVSHEALAASEERYRKLAEQLEANNRMKDEFLATLAHELRNPLAPISNALALLRLAPDPLTVLPTSRDIMERQVSLMARLVEDLLDVSRLTRGLVELRKEPIDVASKIQDAVETSRPQIEKAGNVLNVQLPAQSLIVEADPTRFVQIFANLLNNAAKFTPSGGTIDLQIKREGDHALVIVRDTGIGIPPDMLDRVFDMFTQVERSHASTGGGLGIGLTLVRKLVELHGGHVEARSAGPSKGSEFRVFLPLATSRLAITPRGLESAPTTSPLRILIADDNLDNAETLAMVLQVRGHSSRVASDGEEALSMAREFRPDVVILDIAMPKLDGLATAKAIREEPWGGGVMLVAVSGWGQEADKLKSRKAGFDEHLVKPISLSTLEKLFDARFDAS